MVDAALARLLEPKLTRYIPYRPTPKQAAFLLLEDIEVFFGGAAGPGKSTALLMGALQYVDQPGYAALIVRRTETELKLQGALMAVAKQWLAQTDAWWDGGENAWHFPTGRGRPDATLTFGHCANPGDEQRYQSAEFQYVAVDEVTELEESQYTFLFSRLRRREGVRIPLRMRAASNPGGSGHAWAERRFVNSETRHVDEETGEPVVFLPAWADENPHLDQAAYDRMLSRMDPVRRRQLRLGDWSAAEPGGVFDVERVELLESLPQVYVAALRWWDLAATDPKKPSRPPRIGQAGRRVRRDPDYTVGLKLERMTDGRALVTDIVRGQWAPTEVEQRIIDTAAEDGPNVAVGIPQEPGAAGPLWADRMRRRLGLGSLVMVETERGDKVERTRDLSIGVYNRMLCMLRRRWTPRAFLEMQRFPEPGEHDDIVDALANAWNHLPEAQQRLDAASHKLPERLRAGVLPQSAAALLGVDDIMAAGA